MLKRRRAARKAKLEADLHQLIGDRASAQQRVTEALEPLRREDDYLFYSAALELKAVTSGQLSWMDLATQAHLKRKAFESAVESLFRAVDLAIG